MDSTAQLNGDHNRNVRRLFDAWEAKYGALGKLRSLLEQRFEERRSKWGNLNLGECCNTPAAEYVKRALRNIQQGDILDGNNLFILADFVNAMREADTE